VREDKIEATRQTIDQIAKDLQSENQPEDTELVL